MACETLQDAADVPAALEMFRVEIRGIDCPDDIKAGMMAAYGLGVLSAGLLERAQSVISYLRKNYADSQCLEYVEPDVLRATCPRCEGKKSDQCIRCSGKKQCQRCQGKGNIPGSVIGGRQTHPACPSCRGAGQCAACLGAGVVPCLRCGGRGSIHSPAKVEAQYERCLEDTRSLAYAYEHPEMLAVRKAIREAAKSSSLDAAIFIMQDTIAKYRDADNIGDARDQLKKLEHAKLEAEANLEAKRLLVENAQKGTKTARSAAAHIPSIVVGVLDAWCKGGSGEEYWSAPKKAKRLFAPVTWQIVRTSVVGSFAEAHVRVEADGVGPDAVRSCVFYLEFDGVWRVSAVK